MPFRRESTEHPLEQLGEQKGPSVGPSERQLEQMGPSVGPSVGLLEQMGPAVGLVMEPLGGLMEPLGGLMEPLGGLMEPLGSLMEPLGSLMEPLGGLMEPSGDLMESSGDLMGPSGNLMESSGDLMGWSQVPDGPSDCLVDPMGSSVVQLECLTVGASDGVGNMSMGVIPDGRADRDWSPASSGTVSTRTGRLMVAGAAVETKREAAGTGLERA